MTTLNNFASAVQLSSSTTTLVSTGASETKFLGNVTLTNTSSSNVEVTLWRLPTATSETSGSGGNWIFKKTIPPGLTKVVGLPSHVLGPSMKLSGLAATASVVNFDASGTTEV